MNIQVSERLKSLPPYLFGKLNSLTAQMRRDGRDIVDLGMGNPDKAAPEDVIEKAREVLTDPKAHRYSSSSKGIPQLLNEASKFYRNKYGVSLQPDEEIIATIGSKEGISHLSLALLGPGNSVLVPSPSFPIHIWSAIIAGANVITVPIGRDQDSFISNLFSTYQMLWPKPKLLFLNFPHNPTATVVEREFFAEIVKFALKNEVILVNDFAYADITFDGHKSTSLLEVPDARKVGVEFISMSKSFSMAGWRIGFCLGNPAIIKALEKIKGYYDYGIFTAIQVGAIIALRKHWKDTPAHYASIYQSRRNILVDGLNRAGWQIAKPQATMFVWAPIPEKYRHVGSIRFCQFLLRESEVCVSPGIGFGKEGEGFLRIALVENEERTQQAVRQIRRALQNTSPDKIMDTYRSSF